VIGGNFNLAHRVGFDSYVGHDFLFFSPTGVVGTFLFVPVYFETAFVGVVGGAAIFVVAFLVAFAVAVFFVAVFFVAVFFVAVLVVAVLVVTAFFVAAFFVTALVVAVLFVVTFFVGTLVAVGVEFTFFAVEVAGAESCNLIPLLTTARAATTSSARGPSPIPGTSSRSGRSRINR